MIFVFRLFKALLVVLSVGVVSDDGFLLFEVVLEFNLLLFTADIKVEVAVLDPLF